MNPKINKKLIILAHKEQVINEWEMNFLISILEKESLSDKQKKTYEQLNQRIMESKC